MHVVLEFGYTDMPDLRESLIGDDRSTDLARLVRTHFRRVAVVNLRFRI